jgi:3-phenylpropionate/cinnamic acid dioxygenase small subunit
VSSPAGGPAGGPDEHQARATEEALRQLCLRYAAGVDGRDVANFLDAFAPDAEVRVYEPPGTGDRPDRTMREHSEIGLIVERIAYYSRTIHVIGSCAFELDLVRDCASGVVECVAHHFLPSPQDDTDRTMHVRYEDRYRKDARADWKIVSRDVRVLDREDVRGATSTSQ